MKTTEIEDLLRRTMGLDAASIGSESIRRAVALRREIRGGISPTSYVEQLRENREELQELIEEVVVPETWFFRDAGAFEALTQMMTERKASGDETAWPLRVLSLPCSTGEEPYSLAMALLDAGLEPESFSIDAIDISARALQRARLAVFGRNSFRGDQLSFRNRYFTPEGSRWQLRDLVRSRVRFTRANLLGDTLPEVVRAAAYDVIFCRNLLIYFDRPTQNRSVSTLTALLAPTGCFFVGPSETALMLDHGFSAVKSPRSFAFRRAEPRVSQPVVRNRVAVKSRCAPSPPKVPAARVKRLPFSHLKSPTPRSAGPVGMAEAMRLADQGKLVEARAAGEQVLEQQGPSAAVFYVLGLVRDAAGDTVSAMEFYRKALYLEPRHAEALVHLAILLEERGEVAGASRLMERVRRLEAKVGS
ncbi:CheR family methyltransferase [Synoicihabitans lomoniglobus]|uniref:Tetratricopeptide repeat protein n=1 Tax=Synoicihabitans lomoniglobus TaxID=2909285 RepID=A0AAF0CRH1_9BACT|nr:tetratricopeptide repeat protein [Opitutaceae bacterium LMO-M01]WED66701.1 tetratricopeptide repeat protein [Opitutaceae bacterium LMO-M01]